MDTQDPMDMEKQLKQMPRKKVKGTSGESEFTPELKSQNRSVIAQTQTLEEFFRAVDSLIVKTRHFRTGKVDNYGKVVGIDEFEPGRVPHVHQDHHYDKLDRVIKFEKYVQDFSKPTTRYYFYEGDSDKLSEGLWFDRYGKIENIHQYKYDETTGLMTDRAEYNKEGEIFYQIHSEFDTGFDPPRLLEDTWRDKTGGQLQRYVYEYDENGDVIIERRFDAANRVMGWFAFEYDEQRVNVTGKEWYGPDGLLKSAFYYEHDSQNRPVSVVLCDEAGNELSSQVFVYDEIGNLKEEIWEDQEGNVLKHLKY
jgi:hypothetical protein